MNRTSDRFRSARPLIVTSTIGGATLAALSYGARTHLFVSSLLLTLSGVAFGLAVIPLVYDVYQRNRRQRLWHGLRRQVTRTLAGRIYLLTCNLRWNLDAKHYTSYGSFVEAADTDPTAEATARHGLLIADIINFLDRFSDGYNSRVPLDEVGEDTVSGDHLATVMARLMTPDLRASLRGELSSLAPLAEESADLVVALEELLATGVWLTEYATAARALEMGEREFMNYLRRFVMQLKTLYARAAADFHAA